MQLDERSPEFRKLLAQDFRKFLFYAWLRLGLPEPTPLQYDIANFIQDSSNPRTIVEAYRGIGKSLILEAFCNWCWLRNPNFRILVVSASARRATSFTTMVKNMTYSIPALQYLKPRAEQKSSNIAFDVGPSSIDQSASLTSLGITGQLTGLRADLIIADDVETATNSLTQTARDFLREVIKEFASIVKPLEEGGRVIYLGTPQHESSVYNELTKEREYLRRVWPARYPDSLQEDAYEGSLAPTLVQQLRENPGLVGQPTDPRRFGEQELRRREAEMGRSTFALQFMLDTTLSDAERYPLKIRDLILMPLSPQHAPLRVDWTSDEHYVAEGIPSVGFSGDVWMRPYGVSTTEYVPYNAGILVIDPSGRGSDETAYAVLKLANARLFLLASGGIKGGYDDSTLSKLAQIAKAHNVNKVLVESNFGDGMFTKLFTPILIKVHPCQIEEAHNTKQKEKRIIDTLEPLLNQHRLVVAEDVAINDYRSSRRHENQLFFQLTRITRDRGCLSKDDRIDVLAMGAAYFVEQMARDVDQATRDSMEEALRREFESWENDVLGTSRNSAEGAWVTFN